MGDVVITAVCRMLKHIGSAGLLYKLEVSYERADWTQIDKLAEELGIQTNLLTSLYFNCMEEVNRIWSEITQVSAGQIDLSEAMADTKPEPTPAT